MIPQLVGKPLYEVKNHFGLPGPYANARDEVLKRWWALGEGLLPGLLPHDFGDNIGDFTFFTTHAQTYGWKIESGVSIIDDPLPSFRLFCELVEIRLRRIEKTTEPLTVAWFYLLSGQALFENPPFPAPLFRHQTGVVSVNYLVNSIKE